MTSSEHQLAQLNVARLAAPIDSPVLKDFVDNLDRINGLAERSPGFIWRLQDADGNATSLRPFDDDMIVNLSVWQDVESLQRFVYHTAHVEIMRRRHEWFRRMAAAYTVLWWVPAGHAPGTDEARERLTMLRDLGPTPRAFEFRHPFSKPVKAAVR